MRQSQRLKWMIVVAVFVSSGAANAEAWTSWRSVTYLYPHSGGFVFGLDGAHVGTHACGNRFFLPVAQAGAAYDGIVSTILTAFTAGYPIQVNYDEGTTGNCDIVINRVIVSKP